MRGPDIVDTHVHYYGEEARRDPVAFGRVHGEEAWAEMLVPAGTRSIQGWASLDEMIAAMDQAGVRTAVLVGWYWRRQETCELQNRWILDAVRRHPGRLVGFAAVQPAEGRNALDGLRRSLDEGLCGVGELLPQAQGYGMGDRAFLDVVGLAQERRLPVLLHVTDPEAPAAAGPRTPLEPYLGLAAGHPGAAFILAHWGGGMAFRGAPGGAGFPPNVYFDCAASPLLYPAEVYAKAASVAGADRILFGTDYPLRVFPKTQRKPEFSQAIKQVRGAGLEPGAEAKFLGSNARRLLSEGLAPAKAGA